MFSIELPPRLKSLEEPYIPSKEDEEIVDIDLDDPEVEKAATKIQAGFKGHQTRKEMREKTTGHAADDAAIDVSDTKGMNHEKLEKLFVPLIEN